MAGPTSRATLVLALCAGALLCSPPRVRAWTRANVENAEAKLELDASGEAHVALELEIRVAGGWLSRFELTGLERDTTLDAEHPARLVSEDGQELAPLVKLRKDGSVVFSFPDRKHAPHRGLCRLELGYVTTLAPLELANGASGGLVFSMPAWEVDLHRAAIEVSGPKGLKIASEPDADPVVMRSSFTRGEHSVVRFERRQLPRTVVFSAPLELPERNAVHAVRAQVVRATRGPWLVALIVFSFAWLKLRAARTLARDLGARPLAWIPFARALRTPAIASCCALGAAGYEAHPALGLALFACGVSLALDRGFLRTREAPRARSLARALCSTASWLDATTPLGAGLLGSAYALASMRLGLGAGPGLWLECVLLVTPLFLTATRLHRSYVPARAAVPAPSPRAEGVSLSADAARRESDRAA